MQSITRIFLAVFIILASVAEVALMGHGAFAGWMTAHPHADNQMWVYRVNLVLAALLVNLLLIIWSAIRLRRLEKSSRGSNCA